MKNPPYVSTPRQWLRPSALWIAPVLLIGTSLGAFASDPVGVYAFVGKVVMEPGDSSPERIQIWGGFAVAEGRGIQYAPARGGYMYFKLPPGKEEAARREWNDLKSLAGSEQLVAFGIRYGGKGTVRKPDAKIENPDVYPVGTGLTKMKPREDYAPHQDLITLRKAEKRAAPVSR